MNSRNIFLNYINYGEDERPVSRYPHTSVTHGPFRPLNNETGHDQSKAGG